MVVTSNMMILYKKIGNSYRFYRLILRQNFHRTLKSQIWIYVSMILKNIKERELQRKKVLSEKYDIENIYFLTPQNYTNRILKYKGDYNTKAYQGPYLSLRLRKYITEKTGLKIIDCCSSDLLRKKIKPKALVITWIGPNINSLSTYRYFFQILCFSIQFRKKNIPIITYLPDTWFPDAAIVASILNIFSGGASVILQSSTREALNFGYPAIAKRVVWHFPPSLIRQRSLNSWRDKQNTALLSFSPSGGKKREFYAPQLETLLKKRGFEIIRADGSLSDEGFSSALIMSKIVFTTNFTQDGFYFGSKKYRSRISPYAITGMTWDCFSAKSLLITNSTEALHELGFIKNIHYLDLDEVVSEKIKFVSEDKMEEIAMLAHKQFIKFTSTNSLY